MINIPTVQDNSRVSKMIEHVIVSDVSVDSDNPSSIIQSNSWIIDSLLRSFVHRNELFPEALKSYYVKLYQTHMTSSGGFAAFVCATGWEQAIITFLVDGLESIQANEHIELLGKFTEKLMIHGADGVTCLYDDEHPQNQQMRDFLNELMPEFISISKRQDLVVLNAQWLRNHPKLIVMSEANMVKQVAISAKAVPNRENRIAQALAQEPRHMKLIRLLCDVGKLDFLHLATQGEGQLNSVPHPEVSASKKIWHFDTVQGLHYLSDTHSEATVYNSLSNLQIASVRVEDVEVTG
jgi:hypothetical protein